MKYIEEEGKRAEKKKLTVCRAKAVNRLLYRSGNEKKFFIVASLPLATLQRNDKSPEHCGHSILFFFSLLINYLFVKDTLTTALENESVFPPTEDLPSELDFMHKRAQEKTQKSK